MRLCGFVRPRQAFLWASFSFLPADLREQRLAAPNDFVFQFEYFAENLCRGIVVRGGGGHGLVAARRETPIVLANLLNRYTVAVWAFFAGGPFDKQIGNVVGANRRALVVEAEAVG